MFFKKKCPSCGAKNPIDATICASCDAPFELRQAEGQMAVYDEAIRVYPKDAVVYFNRGSTNKLRGKKAVAVADFEKFITLTDNPQWVEIARQQIDELSK